MTQGTDMVWRPMREERTLDAIKALRFRLKLALHLIPPMQFTYNDKAMLSAALSQLESLINERLP